jgi:hypothetical protein
MDWIIWFRIWVLSVESSGSIKGHYFLHQLSDCSFCSMELVTLRVYTLVF